MAVQRGEFKRKHPTTRGKRKSIPKLLKLAQESVNKKVRERDSLNGYFVCISCSNTFPVEMMNAGHYVPQGSSSFLRFHEWNINGECAGCNCFDKFHLVGYRKNLIAKIGLENVEWLEENRRNPKRWTRSELEEII